LRKAFIGLLNQLFVKSFLVHAAFVPCYQQNGLSFTSVAVMMERYITWLHQLLQAKVIPMQTNGRKADI
jgi:hypothetical protein